MFSYPRHYTREDEFPVNKHGKYRLYSMQYCPYAERTRLVLDYHEIEYEIINIHMRNKPDWFLERGKTVPILEIGDKLLPESLICSEYIDDISSSAKNKLMPRDPFEMAQQRLLVYRFGNAISNFYKATTEEGEVFFNSLDDFESVLTQRKYFGGENISFVDYMIWPWFERTGSLIPEIPWDRFPYIKNWMALMRKDKSVQNVETPSAYYKERLRIEAEIEEKIFDFTVYDFK